MVYLYHTYQHGQQASCLCWYFHLRGNMPLSREDKIYLVYSTTKSAAEKEGLRPETAHARSILLTGETFSMSVLKVLQLVNSRNT